MSLGDDFILSLKIASDPGSNPGIPTIFTFFNISRRGWDFHPRGNPTKDLNPDAIAGKRVSFSRYTN
jgi:hypothetical protein